MRYLVIERFTGGAAAVYERAAARGRMLPDGLVYLDSWIVDEDPIARCFQLMETEDPSLFGAWIAEWADIVDVEVLPVLSSAEAAARVGRAAPEG